jgi:tellurite resistance protein TerC
MCRILGPSPDSSSEITMLHDRHPLLITYKWARRIAITVVGFTVLAVGIAMIVLPGPAIVVIPVGLGILGLEFAWARHWLHKIKERGTLIASSIRGRAKPP